MVPIPRELKYFKGYLTESWKFNNLDFFTAIGGAQELVSSFRMGHLPHWTSDSYINKAQFAFCFSVSCIQRSLDILKNPASLTEILKIYDMCSLPSEKLNNLLGRKAAIMFQIDEQIHNWESLADVNVMAIMSQYLSKPELLSVIIPKLGCIGPTKPIGIVAFLLALKPEQRFPIHVLYFNGTKWESDIYGKSLPGEDRYVAFCRTEAQYFPIVKYLDVLVDLDIFDIYLYSYKQMAYEDPDDRAVNTTADETSEIPELIDETSLVISTGVQPIIEPPRQLSLMNESLTAPYPPDGVSTRPMHDQGVILPAPVQCPFVRPVRYASGPRKVPGLAWRVKESKNKL